MPRASVAWLSHLLQGFLSASWARHSWQGSEFPLPPVILLLSPPPHEGWAGAAKQVLCPSLTFCTRLLHVEIFVLFPLNKMLKEPEVLLHIQKVDTVLVY